MHCVTTVSYSLIINGEPQQAFKPTRGIRQVVPLSLYLFILYFESLSCLLHQAKSLGSIYSVSIGEGPIKINYLFLLDDNLLFCKANTVKWSNMIHILT